MEVTECHNSLFGSVAYRLGRVLVDPGDEWEGFRDVGCVLLTHAHFDHIYGLNRAIELNPSAPVFTNQAGKEALLSDKKNLSRYHETPFVFAYPERIRIVGDGEMVELGGGMTAQAFYTPGHCRSCITWVVSDCVFTGDSYIPGIKLVTNLPGGDRELAGRSEELIRSLAAGRRIFAGHKPGSICRKLSSGG